MESPGLPGVPIGRMGPSMEKEGSHVTCQLYANLTRRILSQGTVSFEVHFLLSLWSAKRVLCFALAIKPNGN